MPRRQRDTDVVVVGAGPAGSTTALLLARAGLTVTLLDQHAFPRAKACGDCISPGANVILERLGVWNDILAAQPGLLQGWALSADGGRAFGSMFAGGLRSVALPREKLDAILLAAAEKAGARVVTGARVTDVLRDSAGRVVGVHARHDGNVLTIPARLTVGADGLRSRIARRLGALARAPRLRKVSLTAHVGGVPDVRDIGEMHVRDGTCLGIAPVDGARTTCNVTVVFPARTAGGDRVSMMRSALRRFSERDLSHLIADDTAILASGPFDWPTRQIAFPGAVLVGDAAGYYDPFTGQGIYQALRGAELLAGYAAAYVCTDRMDELNSYAARQRSLVAPARRIQRAIEFVCARPRLASFAFGRLERAPQTAGRLIDVIGDLRPGRDLLSPRLLARLLA